MLDRWDYVDKWRSRIAGYRAQDLDDALATTDDLGGLCHDRLLAVTEGEMQTWRTVMRTYTGMVAIVH
jgi:hypothetical protein